MLLTVEGGGLFSASASGYSKFVSLLLLSRKDEESSMRVSPWNQYHLVEQETDPGIQLASKKKHNSHRCSFLICFRHQSAALEGTSPPKVGPALSECLANSSVYENKKDSVTSNVGGEDARIIMQRSSLKKELDKCPAILGGSEDKEEVPTEVNHRDKNATMKKIQWTDTCGKELAEIREFEPSEVGSSNEDLDHEGCSRCECTIQ